MNKDNERKLFKRFKFLNKQTMESIACGDGWYGLVYDMCKELKTAGPPDDFYITHIDERYGGLDVRTKNGVMRTRVVIDEFNTLSIELCDECGNNRDLEMCDKCIVPVIEYPDPDDDDSEDADDPCNTCSCDPCECP